MINHFKSKKVFASFCSALLATSSVSLAPLYAVEPNEIAYRQIEPAPHEPDRLENLFQTLINRMENTSPNSIYGFTENLGWAFVNKALPTSYKCYDREKCKEVNRTINFYNRYYVYTYKGLRFVILLPTYGMIQGTGFDLATVENLILDPDNWEPVLYSREKLATSLSQYCAEGAVTSLDAYLEAMIPHEFFRAN